MGRPSPHDSRKPPLKAPSPCRATCATSSCSLPDTIASPIAKNRLQWEELNATAERLRSNLYAIRKRASRHPKAPLHTLRASMVRAWAPCEPKTAARSKSLHLTVRHPHSRRQSRARTIDQVGERANRRRRGAPRPQPRLPHSHTAHPHAGAARRPGRGSHA